MFYQVVILCQRYNSLIDLRGSGLVWSGLVGSVFGLWFGLCCPQPIETECQKTTETLRGTLEYDPRVVEYSPLVACSLLSMSCLYSFLLILPLSLSLPICLVHSVKKFPPLCLGRTRCSHLTCVRCFN